MPASTRTSARCVPPHSSTPASTAFTKRTRRRAVDAAVTALRRDRPIRQNDAAKPVRAAQDVGEQLAIVAGAHLLDALAIPGRTLQDRVRRHHPADLGGECAHEGANVIVEIWTGERCEASVVGVAIPTILRRAVADPVLHDRDDAPGVETLR